MKTVIGATRLSAISLTVKTTTPEVRSKGAFSRVRGAAYAAQILGTKQLAADSPVVMLPAGVALIGALLLCVRYPNVTQFAMAGLVLWALCGGGRTIQAISLSVLITFLNPEVVPPEPSVALLKWLIFGVAGLRLISVGLWRHSARQWAAPLICLAAVALASAMGKGALTALSILKLTAFVVGVSAFFTSLAGSRKTTHYWVNWFFTLHFVVLVASAPLLIMPAGRALNGSGFQGIFGHPQTLGVYLSFFTAFVTASWLCGNKLRLLTIATIPVGWSFIVLSGCRTAVLSLLLATALTVVTAMTVRRDLISEGCLRKATRRLVPLVCLTAIMAVVLGGSAADAITSFIKKGSSVDGSAAGLQEGIAISRGALIENSMESFRQHPWIGGGFGLAAGQAIQNIEDDNSFGIPTSAPVEEGFLFSAILGQMGILGLLSTGVLVVCIGSYVLKRASIPVIVLLFTALFVNCGEMIFFSVGGLGSQMWMLIAVSYGSARLTDRPVRTH